MANVALEKLKNGELSLGIVLRQARSVETAKIMEAAGFDWLFLDLEHNSMSIETASEMSIAALNSGIASLVRVPEFQYSMATRALDGGAQGIIMPHVDNAAQAREVVRQLRYPPVGRRSISSVQVHVDFRPLPVGELTRELDKNFLVAIMIETMEGVENCEEIAAVEGIDVIMIGANDLCLDLGIPGDVMNRRTVEAFERVAAACKRSGRYAGLGGVRTPEDLNVYFKMGYRFILAANDVTLLIDSGRRRTQALRALI
ncbi:HpcH/HpaI aldolase family protein [Sinorhizobium mexicanum]|uniref:Aldolase n=1 Tax=Sinorhizobium mexicanum TaxID=375549 RepID=A0A859QG70_9HYPH|nr:aldolase/citrate lyase family protein [Sinorhizobium mexicanum]MBP1883772.1 2-keto-3-deoxy-L-rhamnonate aldolase RhmA [Sinorhizobium mexicanum]QLL62944.1 aldolase [Sinorhizobium mexicanum]